MDNNIDYLKSYLVTYVNELTTKSKGNMYICPLCGSGTGKHGTGAFSVVPGTNNQAWKCHACGRGGDIITLYGYINGINSADKDGFKIIIHELKKKYSIGDTFSFQRVPEQEQDQDRAYKEYEEKEISITIAEAKESIGKSDYLTKRGISLGVQQRFQIGFIPNYIHPKIKYNHINNPHLYEWGTPRILIPTSATSYLARAITPEPPQDDPRYKYYVKCYKCGEVHIFNPSALSNHEDYCFIVEGEIDALSCIECGFNAIGLGSTSNINMIFNYHIDKKTVLIIAMDNDKSGDEATTKLIELCRKHKQPYIASYPDMLFNCKKDANELLQKDRKALIENLEYEKKRALEFDKEDFFKSLEPETLSNEKEKNSYMVAHHNDTQENISNNHVPCPYWYSKLDFSPRGFILPSLHNVVTILRYDDTYKDKIEFNELREERELNRQKWTDKIESRLKLYLEEEYKVTISIENINHACNNIEKGYHPIRDYINSLKWDGVERIESAFIHFLGAKDNLYTRKVSLVTFLGAIARIYTPGVKYDTCTVFVGRQGIGKSKFIRKLAINSSWFTDDISTFDGKELYEKIKGKWLIELGEGTAFQKSIKERTKQVITQQEDVYRTPYSRHPEERKRQCIFLGTTNNYDFLKDETGDRRFYPIDCDIRNATKSIDDDLTSSYVDQLWAEALYRYHHGEKIYITDKSILAIAEQEQRNHFDESPLQSDIYNFLEILLPPPQEWYSWNLERRRRYIQAIQNGEDTSKTLCVSGVYRRDKVSVKEIMCELFGYDLNQPIERKLSLEVARSLISLGWSKTGKSLRIQPYGKVWIYIK